MREPKPNRALAPAALVVAGLLLPAGFVSHGHDDRTVDGHDHDCVICCLRDHTVVATASAPAPEAPGPLAPAAASTRCRRDFGTALGPRLTRGPPA